MCIALLPPLRLVLIFLAASPLGETRVLDAGGLLAAEVLAPPNVMQQRLKSQVSALWGAVRQRSIFLPTVFVFLWQASSFLSKKHTNNEMSALFGALLGSAAFSFLPFLSFYGSQVPSFQKSIQTSKCQRPLGCCQTMQHLPVVFGFFGR